MGLLYRVAHALEVAGADLRAARISTLGSDVVDAFYLRGDWSSPEARAGIERPSSRPPPPADDSWPGLRGDRHA